MEIMNATQTSLAAAGCSQRLLPLRPFNSHLDHPSAQLVQTSRLYFFGARGIHASKWMPPNPWTQSNHT